jgi:hypothetical protein
MKSVFIRRTIDRPWRAAQGTGMHRLAGFLCAAALFSPHWAHADPLPHRAQYTLRLGEAVNAARIGTAVEDLSADCAGWHLKRDISAEVPLTADWRISAGSKLDAEESRGGRALRYIAAQMQNGNRRETRGHVQRTDSGTRADIIYPSGPSRITLPPATLLPVAAIGHLVERLVGGTTSFPTVMFDAEVMNDAMLVDIEPLDRKALRARPPADRQVLLPEAKSWPISMRFTPGRAEDQRPLFTVTALIFDSGVLDRLTVKTPIVTIAADLLSLELRKPPSCPHS